MRRICLTIKSIFRWWSFLLFLWPSCLIQRWHCKEKLDARHSWGQKGSSPSIEDLFNLGFRLEIQSPFCTTARSDMSRMIVTLTSIEHLWHWLSMIYYKTKIEDPIIWAEPGWKETMLWPSSLENKLTFVSKAADNYFCVFIYFYTITNRYKLTKISTFFFKLFIKTNNWC